MFSHAPIGYLAIAGVPTAVNQGFIVMVCKRWLLNIFVLFWCYENLSYTKVIASGSIFAEISKKEFHLVPVIVPSKQILTTYEEIVRPAYKRIVINMKKFNYLDQFRDLLFSKIISDKLRIPAAKRVMEAVT